MGQGGSGSRRSPAASACFPGEAPPSLASLLPAAARAWRTALSRPSVTNVRFGCSAARWLACPLCMKNQIPAMLESGGGAIVNVSSTAGVQAVGGLAAYVAAKHGIEGLTKVAALDYAARGVRVNAVAPGPILTDHLVRAGEPAQKAAAAAMPLGRIGSREDAAAAVFCSSAADFITGTTLLLDGGKLAGTPPFRVMVGS